MLLSEVQIDACEAAREGGLSRLQVRAKPQPEQESCWQHRVVRVGSPSFSAEAVLLRRLGLPGASSGLGDAGEGLVELGADLARFGAEEDPGEDGAVELLPHGHRRIGVGGVDVLEQVEGVANTLPDLGVLGLQPRPLTDEARLLSVEPSLVGEEHLAVDSVGAVGLDQLGLIRLDRPGLDCDLRESFVVDCLLPVELHEHNLFDAFTLARIQLDRAVEVLDPLLDQGDRQRLALLADGVSASVADEVLVDAAGPGPRVLHDQPPATLDTEHGGLEVDDGVVLRV